MDKMKGMEIDPFNSRDTSIAGLSGARKKTA
jgi:hypothetical protein